MVPDTAREARRYGRDCRASRWNTIDLVASLNCLSVSSWLLYKSRKSLRHRRALALAAHVGIELSPSDACRIWNRMQTMKLHVPFPESHCDSRNSPREVINHTA